METLFRILLFIVGGINMLPSILAFLPKKMSDSYGIVLPTADLELLLRHRAILFGIIGGFMIYSAIFRKYYSPAVLFGWISMASFVLLYFSIDGINQDLTQVMRIDLLAILVLTVGFLCLKFKPKTKANS